MRWVWKKALYFPLIFDDIMVVYPMPPAGRASYCQARRRWVKTASPLGIVPC